MSFWRIIINIFISSNRHNGQFYEQIIEKLSNSYPIRRSAQLTAYFLLKGKDKVSELKDTKSVQELSKKAIDFKKTFEEEFNNKLKDNFKK